MKRELLLGFVFVGLVIILSGFALVPAKTYGEEVFIFINGKNMGLQSAINGGEFDDFAGTEGSYSGDILSGHNSDEIFVSAGGVEKTLQTAINDGSLCLAGSSYVGGIVFGHDGGDILINIGGSEKTLQDAINAGDFLKSWSSLSGTLCTGEVYVQMNNCGGTRKVSGDTCCITSWSPPTSSKCDGSPVQQTSNCGHVQVVDGTGGPCKDDEN
jgi:hypothetical protein